MILLSLSILYKYKLFFSILKKIRKLMIMTMAILEMLTNNGHKLLICKEIVKIIRIKLNKRE